MPRLAIAVPVSNELRLFCNSFDVKQVNQILQSGSVVQVRVELQKF